MKINEKICIAPNYPQFIQSLRAFRRARAVEMQVYLSDLDDSPKRPQGAPQTAHNSPKTQHGPRRPQDGAKTCQDGPRRRQDDPTTPPNHSKTALQALPIIGGRSKIERKSNRYRTFAGQGPPGRGVEGKRNQENNENNQMTERALCEARV